MADKPVSVVGERILRVQDVCAKTALKPSTVYELMGRNAFPRQRKLGSTAAGWLASEVDEWIRNLPVSPGRPRAAAKGRAA